MSSFWLADSEARVLGPVSADVVRDLALRGKLSDVRAVSRDGKTFVPLRESVEVQALLSAPRGNDDIARAQADATKQIRDWLDTVRDRPTHDILRVPTNASREAYRAAFFTLVYRYVPARLPPEATLELRLACEDAFLFLSERMVDIERKLRPPTPVPPTGLPPNAVVNKAGIPFPQAQVTWRGGMVHVRLHLARGEVRPLTWDIENTWKTDSFFVQSHEKPLIGTPAEVTLSFEGHVMQLNATGRVVSVRQGAPIGFAIKMLDMSEAQRSMIRTWVARAS